jgi:serine O-acetyltransferase
MSADLRLKEDLPNLIDRIVESYTRERVINHLGHCPLPRYEVVISVIEDLMEILYPGYRRREGLHLGNVAYYVGSLIDGLHDKLTMQIARALQHERRVNEGIEACDDQVDYEARGQQITLAFLERLPALRHLLASDVKAAFQGDPAVKNTDEVIFCYPGLEAVTVFRLAHELHDLGVPFIPRMMTEWAHRRTGIDIHPGATIGDYFFIDHGTGVVIGATCVIGSHVKIYQGVTLGALSFPTDADGNVIRGMKRHPTIEDRVVIYSNATILGGATTIGHDSVIGANVWLAKTVAPHTTVTMEKPRLRIKAEHPELESHNYEI